MSRTIKFLFDDGCGICFFAEAPADITIGQLLKQAYKIKPDFPCGIRQLHGVSMTFGIADTQPEITFGYNSVRDYVSVIKGGFYHEHEIGFTVA